MDEEDVTAKEMLDVYGFQVLSSQVVSVRKTAYMNILLGLIETLNKPPRSLTETELDNAESELSLLKNAGFKLHWLETKLAMVYFEYLKANLNKEVKDWVKGVVYSWKQWKMRIGFAEHHNEKID